MGTRDLLVPSQKTMRNLERSSRTWVALLGLGMVLAACGGKALPVPFANPCPGSLCSAVSSLTRLVVVRTNAFPQNHIRFSFPARVIVDDETQVRVVAGGLCHLPLFPPGTFHCPADFGVDYQLHFSDAVRSYHPVTVEATGCEAVMGLGGSRRWVATSPRFWRILGSALGIRHADHSTFAGTMPS